MGNDVVESEGAAGVGPPAGAFIAFGAGAGLIAGLLVAGIGGLAPGIVAGAAAGLIVGGARDALITRTREAGRDHGPMTLLRRGLDRLWSRRWVGPVVGALLVAGWAVASGIRTPRGPLTTGQALWSMLVGLAVGAAAGLATRNRWTILAAPLLFASIYEIARLGTDGPLVDGPRASTYGLIALVVGRGVHGALVLLPMAFGASLGAALARAVPASGRPDGGAKRRRVGPVLRRTITVVVALVLVALASAVARPARTAPIVDAAGDRVEGGIAELTTVEVDGHDLGLMIRGHDLDNPVLLFLAGGPGGSEVGAMRRHLPELEEHVTVVTWDQRGTGRSYPALEPTATMTVEAAVADTLAVTDHLRDRFGRERIYLMGQSWGSILGVLAVQAAPERFEAFVGVGQMVSPRATDTIFHEDTLAWADAEGRTGLAEELRRIGPPPYESILDYETALSHEHDVYPYDHSTNAEGAGGFSENLFVEEYTLLEQLHLLAGFLDTFTVLYPQLQDIDFRRDATRFDVPMLFVQGEHEARGRAELFEEWYPMVDAPRKDVTYLDTSGHRPLFEQPEEFVDAVVEMALRPGTPA